MLTKTQLRIMEVFVSGISEKFSIKRASEIIEKPYPLVHRSIRPLIDDGFIARDKQGFLSLNYKENHPALAYIEYLRSREFIKKNKTIALFVKDVMGKVGLDFFVFLVFGSSIRKRNPGDVDILIIVEDKTRISNIEKILDNVASNFSMKFDINVIPAESVYEMLARRDEANVFNETLDNHMLIFGAENYYRLLKNARR